jgi:hypothetical protein
MFSTARPIAASRGCHASIAGPAEDFLCVKTEALISKPSQRQRGSLSVPGHRTAVNLLRLFPLAVLSVLGRHDARGQTPSPPPEPPKQGIEVLPTPYLWLPWTSINVRPNNSRIQSRSNTIDPGEMVTHLTWVPFMGEIEFRYGPYGLITDYIHAPLKAGASTRGVLFSGATSGLTIDSGTAMFLYRAMQDRVQYVDVGGGVRAWGFAGDISLNQGLLPPAVVSNGLSWADPMLAARYHRDLGSGWGLTAYADVGGFGVGANVDWQLVGTIDYKVNSKIDLHAGFRTLNFNYDGPRANFKVHMYGPILSGTYHFN